MGLRDDLRRSLGYAARLGRDGVTGGVSAFNAWGDRRYAERRVSEIDNDIAKAADAAMRAGLDGTHKPGRGPKALHFNPFDLVASMGYRDRPSALTYQGLEMVGRGVPVVADVISTRTAQVEMFCHRPETRHNAGFEVRLRDPKKRDNPSAAARKKIDELTDVMLHTGYYDKDHPEDSTSLAEFAKLAIPDALIFDQVNFEIVPDRKGRPSYLAITDPGTIRLLDPGHRSPGDPFAVQVIDGSIVSDFTRDELAFCIRNPRSGIRAYGYGTSELETLVREITGFLWSIDYNRKFFTQGSATKGVLNFKGTIPDRHLQAFRRQWYAMVSGVSNAWRTPITNAEELQWINMQLSNRDMEYSAWMDFLIKIVCARYHIAPEEVNFSYGNTGQSQAMGTAPIEEKLKASRDLGLRPLVRWFFEQLNTYFLYRLDPDFEIVPYGLDDKGAEALQEYVAKAQQSFMTIDEARALHDLPPLGEEKGGDLINSPQYVQWMQSKQGMGDEDGFGGDEDGFGEPGDDADSAPDFDLVEEDVDTGGDEAIKSEREHPVRLTVHLD